MIIIAIVALVGYSYGISKRILDCIDEIFYDKYIAKGYVLDELFFYVYSQNIKNQLKKSKDSLSFIGKIIDRIEDIVPIYNIWKAKFICDNSCEIIIDSLIKQHYLIPATHEDEKLIEEYKKDGKKYFCSEETQKTLTNQWEKELLNEKTLCLYFDPLPYLGYNLEDVEKINEIFGGSYILGDLEGVKVAIVGIPEKDVDINTILLPKEKFQVKHEFISIYNVDKKNSKFVIYSYKGTEDNSEILNYLNDLEDKRLKKLRNGKIDTILSVNKQKRLTYNLKR